MRICSCHARDTSTLTAARCALESLISSGSIEKCRLRWMLQIQLMASRVFVAPDCIHPFLHRGSEVLMLHEAVERLLSLRCRSSGGQSFTHCWTYTQCTGTRISLVVKPSKVGDILMDQAPQLKTPLVLHWIHHTLQEITEIRVAL